MKFYVLLDKFPKKSTAGRGLGSAKWGADILNWVIMEGFPVMMILNNDLWEAREHAL